MFFAIFLFSLSFFPLIWWFLIPYFSYYFFDKSPVNGGVTKRYSLYFRSLPIWTWFCQYYPITIHKTVDLKPTFELVDNRESKEKSKDSYYINLKLSNFFNLQLFKKADANHLSKKEQHFVANGPRYIFGYHPHGCVSMGVFGGIATEGANWSILFPGIPISTLTLTAQFKLPYYRDYLMALGVSSVKKQNIQEVLKRNMSICIVIGGARESLLSRPHSKKLVLKNRKGFIKMALSVGNISVVPVYGFGENELYNVLEPKTNSFFRKFQDWLKGNFGFTLPLFHARGVFNYDWGVLPFRHSIDIVVGKPIEIPKIDNPTTADVDYYHQLYIDELTSVYDNNKERFGYTGTLEFAG
ncbi:diacylglycerol O-acyltransferase [Ascoidea rubescens DSM 1968]|uniref:Diacylglycerol O-acyltransferase n=1 Tax=Ascoidea rubescens DSM 1968 TaxID=1344418 RepID=A0A1D2VJL2_9ASCO|nr:DAGAT-domain-containing protein [Ascoidea rubescens DSM 1968]ODV61697.1 DAGAT-domain-containing protein [Ascoidea rubescens DSM 1968]